MLRSTHQRILAEVTKTSQEILNMHAHAKALQISSLEKHIADLQKLVFTPNQYELPEVLDEADKVITQNDAGMPLPSEATEADLVERDRLLNGDWDEVRFN